MLPETTIEQAEVQAERLRSAIEKLDVQVNGDTIKLSASFGVSGSVKHQVVDQTLADYGMEKMINDADAALYTAKKGGKNQVQLSYR